jgi:uncharacterized protein YoxC
MDLTTTNLLLTGILVLLTILTFVVIFVGFHFFRLIEEMRKTINTVDNDYNNLKNNVVGVLKNTFSLLNLFKK